MSGITAGGSPQSGWFPDPAGSPSLRWWDGFAWTDNFINPATGAPVPAPGYFAEASRFAEPAPVQQAPVEETPVAPFAPLAPGLAGSTPWVTAPPPSIDDAYRLAEEPAYVPMTPTRPAEPVAEEDYHIGSASNAAIWIFAILPILHIALVWYVYTQLRPADDSIIRWAVLAGPIVLYIILAGIDHGLLRRNGHTTLAPAVLAIIPLLYLGIRAARVGVRALAPLLVWLVLQAAAVAGLYYFFPAVITQLTSSAAPVSPAPSASITPHVLTAAERAQLLTPAGMQRAVKATFLAKGITFDSMLCQPLTSTVDGALTTCVGDLAGTSMTIPVTVDSTSPTTAFDLRDPVPSG